MCARARALTLHPLGPCALRWVGQGGSGTESGQERFRLGLYNTLWGQGGRRRCRSVVVVRFFLPLASLQL